jgi:hypothetical protein
MRRRRRITRFLTRGLATVAIGGFLGFLVPTVITDLSPKEEVLAQVPESPVARRFINAFTADDQAVLTEMNLSADIKLRASRFRADFARIDLPVHLGSYVGGGGQTLHGYAAHAVMADGTDTTLSWRVVTAGGQVALIAPPAGIEPP